MNDRGRQDLLDELAREEACWLTSMRSAIVLASASGLRPCRKARRRSPIVHMQNGAGLMFLGQDDPPLRQEGCLFVSGVNWAFACAERP